MEQTIASSKYVECTFYSIVIHVTSLKKEIPNQTCWRLVYYITLFIKKLHRPNIDSKVRESQLDVSYSCVRVSEFIINLEKMPLRYMYDAFSVLYCIITIIMFKFVNRWRKSYEESIYSNSVEPSQTQHVQVCVSHGDTYLHYYIRGPFTRCSV